MISGNVNLLRQPSISILVMDNGGQPRSVTAHLDTGFSGDLTLPKASIERLDIRPIDRAISYRIGDGARSLFNSYAAAVLWHDSIRHITVLESEIFPVVGVGLLWGNNLSVDFRHGGRVTITEIEEDQA